VFGSISLSASIAAASIRDSFRSAFAVLQKFGVTGHLDGVFRSVGDAGRTAAASIKKAFDGVGKSLRKNFRGGDITGSLEAGFRGIAAAAQTAGMSIKKFFVSAGRSVSNVTEAVRSLATLLPKFRMAGERRVTGFSLPTPRMDSIRAAFAGVGATLVATMASVATSAKLMGVALVTALAPLAYFAAFIATIAAVSVAFLALTNVVKDMFTILKDGSTQSRSAIGKMMEGIRLAVSNSDLSGALDIFVLGLRASLQAFVNEMPSMLMKGMWAFVKNLAMLPLNIGFAISAAASGESSLDSLMEELDRIVENQRREVSRQQFSQEADQFRQSEWTPEQRRMQRQAELSNARQNGAISESDLSVLQGELEKAADQSFGKSSDDLQAAADAIILANRTAREVFRDQKIALEQLRGLNRSTDRPFISDNQYNKELARLTGEYQKATDKLVGSNDRLSDIMIQNNRRQQDVEDVFAGSMSSGEKKRYDFEQEIKKIVNSVRRDASTEIGEGSSPRDLMKNFETAMKYYKKISEELLQSVQSVTTSSAASFAAEVAKSPLNFVNPLGDQDDVVMSVDEVNATLQAGFASVLSVLKESAQTSLAVIADTTSKNLANLKEGLAPVTQALSNLGNLLKGRVATAQENDPSIVEEARASAAMDAFEKGAGASAGRFADRLNEATRQIDESIKISVTTAQNWGKAVAKSNEGVRGPVATLLLGSNKSVPIPAEDFRTRNRGQKKSAAILAAGTSTIDEVADEIISSVESAYGVSMSNLDVGSESGRRATDGLAAMVAGLPKSIQTAMESALLTRVLTREREAAAAAELPPQPSQVDLDATAARDARAEYEKSIREAIVSITKSQMTGDTGAVREGNARLRDIESRYSQSQVSNLAFRERSMQEITAASLEASKRVQQPLLDVPGSFTQDAAGVLSGVLGPLFPPAAALLNSNEALSGSNVDAAKDTTLRLIYDAMMAKPEATIGN